MKKFILFVVWIIVSIFYLYYGADQHHSFIFLRLNLWTQMTITAFVLAASGAILQVLLHNPIADPWLLGVSGASSLGSVIASLFAFSPLIFWRTLFSLSGSAAVLLTLFFSQKVGIFNVQRFVLIGIGINALCSSLIIFLQGFFTPNDFFASLARISGHFSVRSFSEQMLIFPALIIIWLFLCIRNRELSILRCGEELAETVGVAVQRVKYEGFIICSTALALVVSLSGSIGFIGLAAPHIIRLIFGEECVLDTMYLLPVSGILILSAALLARVMPNGVFIPTGSAMALIGAPIFIYIISHYSQN